MATVTKPIALDESFNTTEVTPRNIADVLAEGLSHITGRTASEVEYDNTDSGLTADNVQDALDEINGKIPTVDIQTAVDEFETYNGGLLSECKVALSPNQDLHGYDSPWVGGAGKNKLEDTFNTGTLLDVVITADNGVIDLNGTGTGENSFAIKSRNTSGNYIYMPKGSYIFSAQGIGSGVVIGTTYNGAFSEIARNDSGESVAFSITDNTPSDYKLADGSVLLAVYITVHARAYNHQKVYPMIRLSSVVDDSFEPYSNICPISGHTQVKVGDDGKNRFNPSTCVLNKYIDDDGTIGNANGFMYSQPICVKDGSYKFSGSYSGSGSYSVRILGYDKDDNFVSLLGRQGGSASQRIINVDATVTSGIKFVRLSLPQAINEPQLELGSTATAYVPYNGYQVTVNLGGTYYSGTLDIVTGVFTPDTAFDTLSADNFNDSTGTSGGGLHFYDWNNGLSKKSGICLCSMMPQNNTLAWQSTTPCIQMGSGGGLIRCYVEEATKEAFKTAYSGMQIVYELATPTPIQLSPTMVKALVGENHLSAPLDGQEITESKYKQMFTFDDVIAYIQSLS